jgi:hypothetical protein
MLNQICRSGFRSDKASVLNGLKNDLNLMRLLEKKFKNKPTRLSQDNQSIIQDNNFVCIFFVNH